ncbi:MAG: hypothetical protein ABH834_03795 [Candidatus Altiarchaeota archaeon]
MRSRGQSAIEWLLTHSWSIIVVLSVSAVLFYAGVFEASARPRFEGLASSGVQPVSEQVQLYSDGVLVFTVLNTRPYPIRLEWVEVAPIADREDVLRTDIGELIGSGDVGVFNVNASNLLSGIMESSMFLVSLADAFPSTTTSMIDEVSTGTVSFFICWNESYIVGGRSSSHVVCGKGLRIASVSDSHSGGGGGGGDTCLEPLGFCPCEEDGDCPAILFCKGTCVGGSCEDICFIMPETFCPSMDPVCEYCACVPSALTPEEGACKVFPYPPGLYCP